VTYDTRLGCFNANDSGARRFPLIYCEKCGHGARPEKDLPVGCPTMLSLPLGESQLAGWQTL